jgi:hypothetical protein
MYTIDVTWPQAAAWMAGLLGAGFLVSWLATDVRHTPRNLYILILAVVTSGLTGGYLVWAGVDVAGFGTHRAAWGVLGGMVVALPVSRGITRLPATRRTERAAAGTLAWEGLVYGITEGVLLSALPALVVWNAADTAGWTAGWPGIVATWITALLASAVMIAVHHFGYWDYRNRQVLPVIAGCGLLTLAFLVTGSVLAPVIGHIAMHIAGILHGVELPPHAHTDAAAPQQPAPAHP